MYKNKLRGQINYKNEIAIFVNSPKTRQTPHETLDIHSIYINAYTLNNNAQHHLLKEYNQKMVEIKFLTKNKVDFDKNGYYTLTESDAVLSIEVL